MPLRYIVFSFFFCGIGSLLAQGSFPDSWFGNYKGTLEIYGTDSVKMKVNMELKIAATRNDSIYDWHIKYEFNGKEDLRNYSLRLVDTNKGHYCIDEKNSIVIDSYLFNKNNLSSVFSVENNMIMVRYSLESDNIIFELWSVDQQKKNITGKGVSEGQPVPEVSSFLINGQQRAVLKKVI
ncbi:MAG: hypothetical protein U5K51_08205 [Flavobacteriaceae bacterium]|nr:hypothetical protein [Flavobacteriaceae bacterium]